MRFIQFDYHPEQPSGSSDVVADWWSDHWLERNGLSDNQFGEPSWKAIEDIVTKPGIILEAGCGVPSWVKHFDSLGFFAIGVDFAPSGLQIGRNSDPDLNLIRSDFRSLALADNSVDYILSLGAIEHDPDGPIRALKEFRRVLAPSTGRLMCSVPCLNMVRRLAFPYLVLKNSLKKSEFLRKLWKKEEPFLFYQYVWSPATYRKYLEAAGFRVLDIRGYGYPPESARLQTYLNKRFKLFSPHMMIAICATDR